MSGLMPKDVIHAGKLYKDHKDFAEAPDIIDALMKIELYMSRRFHYLEYAVSEIQADICDYFDERDQFQVVVYTDSNESQFETLSFRYITEAKELVSKIEDEIINDLKTISAILDLKLYFAIYNEEDREDGNPLFQSITTEEIEDIKTIAELFGLAGKYTGDGCIEVRVKSRSGEDTIIYFDNKGYEIIGGTDEWLN